MEEKFHAHVAEQAYYIASFPLFCLLSWLTYRFAIGLKTLTLKNAT